jgi:hypothetical protein
MQAGEMHYFLSRCPVINIRKFRHQITHVHADQYHLKKHINQVISADIDVAINGVLSMHACSSAAVTMHEGPALWKGVVSICHWVE